MNNLEDSESGGLGRVQAAGFSARVPGSADFRAPVVTYQLSPETSARNGFTDDGDHFTDEETELSQQNFELCPGLQSEQEPSTR